MGESNISEIQFSDFRCIGVWHRWKGACGGSDIAGGTTLNNYTLNSWKCQRWPDGPLFS